MLILVGNKLKDLSQNTQTQNNEIKHLDVSNNLLKSGKEFTNYLNLESLIIDNNYYFNLNDFPQLPQLITLSANKNNFNNLEIFIEDCKLKFPKLTHLSLIKNPICPMFIGEEEYQIYRSTLIKQLKNLKNLDGVQVNPKEIDPNYFQQQKFQQKQQQQLNNQDQTKGTIEFNLNYSKPLKAIDLLRTTNYDDQLQVFVFRESRWHLPLKFLIEGSFRFQLHNINQNNNIDE